MIVGVAERWTRQRRLEHTRGVLLDAAEVVFAEQGFAGATLEDIAEAAGYSRGAIYSHFGAKDELFLAVIERHLQRFLSSFEDVLAELDSLDSLDVARFAGRWRELTIAAPSSAALGYEFSLFLWRNPDARARLAAQRAETIALLTDYIETHIAKLGGTLRLPAETLARVLIASHEGIAISGYLDDCDLYQPFLEMVLANVVPKPLGSRRSPRHAR